MDINDFARVFPSSTYRIVHPTEKYPIDNNVYDLEEALSVIRARGNTNRLGWVVDSEHIVIDIDCDHELDKERDKAVRVFKAIRSSGVHSFLYTTEHGMHVIFRLGEYQTKSVVKVMCGLGVKIDIRVHGSYVIIPFNDPKRKWWNGSSTQLDEIPYFLKVVSKSRNVNELWNLAEGDGRNDAMFRLLQVLKTSQLVKLTADEVKNSILLCNNFILKTPMTERELYATILRPENLVVSAKQNSASVCADYAMLINQENDIIYTNGVFFRISDDTKIYHQVSDEEMDRFIYTNYTKELSSRNREEVMMCLRHEAYVNWSDCNRDVYDIPFLNGIYNIRSNAFRQTLESDNITYCIPHKYNPEVLHTANADSFYKVSLEDNPAKKEFFSQMLGYSMTRSAEFQVFYMFRGRGGTGKSTLLDIVRNCIGNENIANLQLTDFNNEFGVEALFNKLVNLGDDVSGTTLVDSQVFKKATSGDVINVNRKYKDALVFAPFAKCIFTINGAPKIADKTRAMERRMRIVSSDRVILPSEIVPNFVRNFSEDDFAAIINNALLAFHSLLASGARTFPDPEESKEMKEKLRIIGDHIYSFVKTQYGGQDVHTCLAHKGIMSQYQIFVDFCRARNYQVTSLDTFREQICDILEYVTGDEMNTEVFLNKEVVL